MRPQSRRNRTPMAANGTSTESPAASAAGGRVDWVDYAKGICIVMVVMMHSVLGVELASAQSGFMHILVAFAKPFRMPDFFLISGLFLALVIGRGWRVYLDRKVVHFAYFYVLWVTIQFGFKAPSFAAQTTWSHAALLYLESYSERPLVSLMLGLAGACAIVTLGTLLARMRWLNFLRFLGEHSIVIYLAFFLPMAATRTLLLHAGSIHDIGAISLIVTFAGVVG